MKALYLTAALLVASPAFAADYTGGTEFVSGSGQNCLGVSYKVEIEGTAVKAKLFPANGSTASMRDVAGTIAPDGTIVMSYTAGYGSSSGTVQIELKLEGDKITGYSQSQTCRYKVTATRS